jgi:phospholipase C
MAAAANQLGSVEHIVVLVLENRSFDHMLGFLYADAGNVSPATKQPFEGLTGKESNPDASGAALPISALTPGTAHVYFTPGADPGEGFLATNAQLFGTASPGAGVSATNTGFVTDFAATLKGAHAHGPIIPGTTASDIMRVFTPELCRCCRDWLAASGYATTGSAPCRRRRFPTELSCARRPVRATWMTPHPNTHRKASLGY